MEILLITTAHSARWKLLCSLPSCCIFLLMSFLHQGFSQDLLSARMFCASNEECEEMIHESTLVKQGAPGLGQLFLYLSDAGDTVVHWCEEKAPA